MAHEQLIEATFILFNTNKTNAKMAETKFDKFWNCESCDILCGA